MGCCFRPHDHDRTTESMEGVWVGYWATLEGCWAAHKRGFYGSPVNHWSINQTPKGTKLDRRSTGGVPRPLGKSWSFRECLTPAHSERQKGDAGGHRSAGLQNGQRGKARMQETNTYAK